MGYSTLDIERGLKISRERLREWTAKGFIVPSIPSPGQGRRAEFSRDDLLTVALFDELLKIGFQRKMAGKIVKREGQYLWGASDICRTGPDFLMIKFYGDQVAATPVWRDVKMIVDLGDGGKQKLINPITGKFIPSIPRVTDDLEKPFDHLHLVNLEGIKSRVYAAFPK